MADIRAPLTKRQREALGASRPENQLRLTAYQLPDLTPLLCTQGQSSRAADTTTSSGSSRVAAIDMILSCKLSGYIRNRGGNDGGGGGSSDLATGT